MLLPALLLAACYAALIIYSLLGWYKIPRAASCENTGANVFVTIVVPARNEANNIEPCLQAIGQQTYPADLVQVIVVDDHSTDNTAVLAAQYGAQVLTLTGHTGISYKKSAIELAVKHAKGQLIVATDADTFAQPQWLDLLVACFKTYKPVFIAAPVGFYDERNALQRFQSLDMLGMMVLTGAGIQQGTLNLCNGANMAFAKSAFEAIGGYADASAYASGDDMFLMKKMKAYFPRQIAFVKHPEAMVFTKTQPSLKTFVAQRLRWASKMQAFFDMPTVLYSGTPFLLSWAILAAMILMPWMGENAFAVVLLMFGIKLIADFALLSTACSFFGRPELLRYFWQSQLLHIIYMAGIGLMSFFVKKYTWKGRVVN